MTTQKIQIERTYPAAPEKIWELWTTAAGIESWWAPEGFDVHVETLELKPGGALVYTMTAVGPDQVAFMEQVGLPLSTTSTKAFTEVEPVRRLAYTSLADFIPGVEPYDFLTEVELRPTADGGTHVVMTADAMHDEEWTGRLSAGRTNEMDNLGKVVGE
ncbi:Activator of Hsp90 ATPase 1 family protein [Catenulispora acidiphila DSM 44928]|uniref:Activator of Hsp90 ATPase 1 family protein n=1 Tax=Catenulispora acidiphila (strain DSM 44928 / JCM 14897 / NBRC 102108 / NRRL B-24433 / ID139908) TaxID=479433 RepID=C7PVI9_CATAD|nr:SRPBCC domain-containing protein [Catenulispora acidiphila]ACU69345.1 Activator of Hsp90 ATPase 1 family protein [Catenulispora acidiphila DSM 44928]